MAEQHFPMRDEMDFTWTLDAGISADDAQLGWGHIDRNHSQSTLISICDLSSESNSPSVNGDRRSYPFFQMAGSLSDVALDQAFDVANVDGNGIWSDPPEFNRLSPIDVSLSSCPKCSAPDVQLWKYLDFEYSECEACGLVLTTDNYISTQAPVYTQIFVSSLNEFQSPLDDQNSYLRPRKPVKRGRLSPHQTKPLEDWLSLNRGWPYPNKRTKLQLSNETALSLGQITHWFNRARRKLVSAAEFDEVMTDQPSLIADSQQEQATNHRFLNCDPWTRALRFYSSCENSHQLLNRILRPQGRYYHLFDIVPEEPRRSKSLPLLRRTNPSLEAVALSVSSAKYSLAVHIISPRASVVSCDRSQKDGCQNSPAVFPHAQQGTQFFASKSKVEEWLKTLPDESATVEFLTVTAQDVAQTESVDEMCQQRTKVRWPFMNPNGSDVQIWSKELPSSLSDHGTKMKNRRHRISRHQQVSTLNSHQKMRSRSASRGLRSYSSSQETHFFHSWRTADASDRHSEAASSASSANSACSYTSFGSRRGRRLPFKRTERTDIITEESTRYRCTFCGDVFTQKSSWKRHEESAHVPSQQWVCGPPKPENDDFVGQLQCPFCTCEGTSYLEPCRHGTVRCWNEPKHQRTFFRKDAFCQHIKGVHDYPAAKLNILCWTEPRWIDPKYFFCPYCGFENGNWQERSKHVAQHFEEDPTILQEWPPPFSVTINGSNSPDPANPVVEHSRTWHKRQSKVSKFRQRVDSMGHRIVKQIDRTIHLLT